MRFSLGLHTDRVDLGDEFIRADSIAAVARAAEKAGFDAVHVTDHPFPADDWMAQGGHHALDPFVPLSAAATATTTLRLMTNIYVLPYRNPFLAAKSVTSLDVLSGGRLILGLASGYLEKEFHALGADFNNRNDLCDDAIRAMKAAWTTAGVTMEGPGYSAQGHTMLPQPIQKPHPPLWVGGNAKRAIRRAVDLCDGWIPMHNPSQFAGIRRSPAIDDADDLKDRISYARDHAAKVGRTAPLEISYGARGTRMFNNPTFDYSRLIDNIHALAEVGITYMTVGLPGESTSEHVETAEKFGDKVISQLG